VLQFYQVAPFCPETHFTHVVCVFVALTQWKRTFFQVITSMVFEDWEFFTAAHGD
jgi:hypothetical protein